MLVRTTICGLAVLDMVRAPTTWTVLQHDGPDHLGLWHNALPEHQMALITSDCDGMRSLSIKWH